MIKIKDGQGAATFDVEKIIAPEKAAPEVSVTSAAAPEVAEKTKTGTQVPAMTVHLVNNAEILSEIESHCTDLNQVIVHSDMGTRAELSDYLKTMKDDLKQNLDSIRASLNNQILSGENSKDRLNARLDDHEDALKDFIQESRIVMDETHRKIERSRNEFHSHIDDMKKEIMESITNEYKDTLKTIEHHNNKNDNVIYALLGVIVACLFAIFALYYSS